MKQNKAREFLINGYIEALKDDEIPWDRPWKLSNTPVNAKTNTKYHGINYLVLSYVAQEKEYKDNRWCTYNQAKEKNWKIKKGEKGVPVEFWSMYDTKEKKTISFIEYARLSKEDDFDENRYAPISKTYVVFNGEQIDGIPEYKNEDIRLSNNFRNEFLDNVIKNMGVTFINEGDRAFYSESEDKVVVPRKEMFKDEYGYCATSLHELCHATGHESRLNRNLKGGFGSDEYAKEELRAEIGSSFLMADLDITKTENHINNHKAYIQCWISTLEKNPKELFKAIKEAEIISKYVKEIGEYEKLYEEENNRILEDCIDEIDNELQETFSDDMFESQQEDEFLI